MALAAGPLTPIKERGEGVDGEGASGDDQQEKGETWEGTEPLGGTAAGDHFFISFLAYLPGMYVPCDDGWCVLLLAASSKFHGMESALTSAAITMLQIVLFLSSQ